MELHNRNAFIGRWAMPALVSVVLLVSIWVGSLTHHRGLVLNDSSYYLRQAAFFVEGLGVNSLGDVEPAPFTLWPLGYPVAIAGAAKLTGLSVFWAAKVVNSMAALLVVLLLVRALPQTGMVASLALLSGGMIATFSSTYSEGVFILAMLAAALALARVIAADSSRAAIALAICIGVAFTVRYVGIVLLGPVLIAGIWVYALRRYRTARLLAGSWVGAAMFVGGYLALNLYISGALLQTMGPRLESLSVFSYETAKAFAAEANFVFLFVPNPRNPVLLAAFAAVLVLTFIVSAPIVALLRRRSSCLNRIDSGERVTIAVLAFTGVLFWASMVVLKFYQNFNTLDFRYLGPGTVLVTAAALSVLTAVGFSQRSWLRVATVLIVLTSVTYSGVFVPLRPYREQPTFFTERMEKTLTQYEHVPSGSVVLQGPLHLLFLRPDLMVIPPRRLRTQRRLDRVLNRALKTKNPVWREVNGRPIRIATRLE